MPSWIALQFLHLEDGVAVFRDLDRAVPHQVRQGGEVAAVEQKLPGEKVPEAVGVVRTLDARLLASALEHLGDAAAGQGTAPAPG